MDKSIISKLHLFGLMPCPLKVPFESLFNTYAQEQQKRKGVTLRCLIESNANKQFDFFSWLKQSQDINELPDIMIAPGFNDFFYGDFQEKFIDKGYFRAAGRLELNPSIGLLPLQDPEGSYSIPCFNPTLMLVDRTNHPDLPLPRRWEDLLQQDYYNGVAIRGHQHSDFCEGLILNIYKKHGEEGVRKLGRATKIGLHPSQMVKLAGSGKAEAPVVSAIPYSFARLVRSTEHVSIIWPEDGAIVNPIVMLVKDAPFPEIRELGDFLAGKEIGDVYSSVFFPSSHPQVHNLLPAEAHFKWLGWDFIREMNLGSLIPRLEQIFLKAYWEGKS